MKVKFWGFVAVAFLATVFSLSSCEIETSKNGDLDGFWHLERIDSLDSGQPVDYSKRRAFWGVEHKLIYAYDADLLVNYYFRFTQTPDSLIITSAYLDHGHQDNGAEGGDIPVTEVTDSLRYYGIETLPQGFKKEALNGNKMVLKSQKVRLSFKRF